MNRLISDLRNMVASSRHTGKPIDTERVAAAVDTYLRASKTEAVVPLPAPSGETWPFYGLNQLVDYGNAREAAVKESHERST